MSIHTTLANTPKLPPLPISKVPILQETTKIGTTTALTQNRITSLTADAIINLADAAEDILNKFMPAGTNNSDERYFVILPDTKTAHIAQAKIYR